VNSININNEENNSKKLINGAFSLSLATLIVKVFGLIYKIPMSYILGDEGMGYFNSAYTVYGFFYILCTAGVPKAVTMVITKNKNSGKRIYKTALSVFSMVGLTATIVFMLFALPISKFIGNSKSFYSMLLIAPSIFFVSAGGVSKGYFNARSSLVSVSVSQVIEAVGKLVFGLCFSLIALKLRCSIPVISAMAVLGISIGSALGLIYLIIKAKKINIEDKKGQSINKSEIIKGILKITIPITASASLLSISNVFDLILIMRGLEANGISEELASSLYGNYTTLAIPMLNLVSSILAPISIASFPYLVTAFNSKDKKGFERAFCTSVKVCSFIAFPCSLVFSLYSFDILEILFSSSASVTGAGLLVLLSPSVFLLPLLTIVNSSIEATSDFKNPLLSLLIGAIVKMVLTFALIKKIGIAAAPISTSVSYLISLIYSLIILGKQVIISKVIKAVIPSFLFTAIAFALPNIIYFSSQLFSLNKYSGYFIIFLSVFLYFLISFVYLKRIFVGIKYVKIDKNVNEMLEK